MIILYPQFVIRDWTLPPEGGVLDSAIVYHDNQELIYKRVEFWSLLDSLIEQSATDRLFVLDLHLLFACLLWHMPTHPRTQALYKAIYECRIVSLNDLTKVSESVRGWKALLEKHLVIPSLVQLAKEADALDRWLLRSYGESKSNYLGAHVETLGRAAAMIVTWAGVRIDPELLASGYKFFKEQAPHDMVGQWNTLASHYRQVHQTIRNDGCCHPVYHRLATYRLGSNWPNIQNFTASGGEFASKQLIIPNTGEILVGYDLKLAELHSLAYCWTNQFGEEGQQLLLDLNAGLDLHQETGKILFPNSDLIPELIRTVGKITNFAILNLSGVRRINENLEQKNLPTITSKQFNKAFRYLCDRYPIEDWHKDARKAVGGKIISTHYGRQIRVLRPQQYTGYQFQVLTGDSTALAALEIIMSGVLPRYLIHDEIFVSTTSENITTCHDAYLRGFGKLLPPCTPQLKISQYHERWGIIT